MSTYGESSFFLFSFAMAVLLTCMAILPLIKHRYLIVKPTFLAGLLGVARSWSSLAHSEKIFASLPNPWHYTLATDGVALILLLIAGVSAKRSAKDVWNIFTSVKADDYRVLIRLLPLLGCVVVACMAIYFVYVPPWRTGLWIALQHGDATLSRDAREESLKLLPAIPRYVFAFNREVATRFAAVVLMLIGVAEWHSQKKRIYILIPATILALAVSASIYGARGPGGMVIASAFLAWMLHKKLPLNAAYIAIGIGVVLLIPTTISVIRIGGELSPQRIWDEFYNTILYRLLFTGLDTAIWHIDYVQRNGYWGVSAIPKLAMLFGVTPVNVDNLIMNIYFKDSATALATTGSFVTNYTRWGLLGGIAFSVASYWMLDAVLSVVKKLQPTLVLPAVTMLLVWTRGSLGSNFESLFITRGLIPGLMLIWLCNKLLVEYRRREAMARMSGNKDPRLSRA